VASRLDLVALSLFWTEGAGRRPIRRSAAANLPSPDLAVPDPRTLVDLDAVLALLDIEDVASRAAGLRRRAAEAIVAASARGIGLTVRGDPAYPSLLERIHDPPPALWSRGVLGPCPHAVAIVGSRTATRHGLEIAFRLGFGLARAGLTVVSGLARGVDAEAHRGALRGGGPTLAVLGCGADIVYPPEHAALAEEVAASGALVSEFAPGVPPHGWHFPLRNRIISGLALGVVIVEAAQRSGSLITARCAAEQGRSVMAVPGAVLSGRNRGAHALLRDGAGFVEDAEDVIGQLQADWHDALMEMPVRAPEDRNLLAAAGAEDGGAGPGGDPILRAMKPGDTYSLEQLAAETGLAPPELISRLARLEVGGRVLRVEGGQFVKAGANVLR
jgi:DNA processing protein